MALSNNIPHFLIALSLPLAVGLSFGLAAARGHAAPKPFGPIAPIGGLWNPPGGEDCGQQHANCLSVCYETDGAWDELCGALEGAWGEICDDMQDNALDTCATQCDGTYCAT